MKFNFKKISAIAGSVLMTGMTLGFASAAAFPAPFVQNGAANAAIVYGAAGSADATPAATIQSALGSYVKGGETVTISGESYKIEKTNTKFHIGDTVGDVIGIKTIDDDELGEMLASGQYRDADNDEFDYDQNVVLNNTLQLTLFTDNDYKRDTPTVGIKIPSGQEILTYTLDMSDEPTFSDAKMKSSDLPLMGKTYYVLDTDNSSNAKLTLLDSAETTILAEGETKTVDGKKVSIEYIGSAPEVKLSVDGELTNSLGEGQTYKLNDGSYVGVKDIMYDAKDNGISRVEFSIGNGKLVVEDGKTVKMNDKNVDGLTGKIDIASGKMTDLKLTWSADDDLFVTKDSSPEMPGFKTFKLSYTGYNAPATETFSIESDGDENVVLKNFPLKTTTETIPFGYYNGSAYTYLGKDNDEQLLSGASPLAYDYDTYTWMVVSYMNGDDAESYLIRATNFNEDGNHNYTDIQYRKDGSWVDKKTNAENGDSIDFGSASITLGQVWVKNKTVTFKAGTNTVFNKLYTPEGLEVSLPASTDLNTTVPTATFILNLTEEDKDNNIAKGDFAVVTLGSNSASTPQAQVSNVGLHDGSNFQEKGDSGIYEAFMYSPLATEFNWNKDADQDSVEVTYHGGEVTADVYLSSADAVKETPGTNALGNIIFKDSEKNSWKDKNVIIVGGTCVNTAAAEALQLPEHTCGAAFTTATGVQAGQFLIKGVQDAFTSGKLALVVAGYEAEDTVAAATLLTTKMPDTSASKIYSTKTLAEVA